MFRTSSYGWQKSKHSVNNGACVEVNRAETLVGVRDTKEADKSNQTILGFSRRAWQEFTERVKVS